MKNIHILATSEASRLYLHSDKGLQLRNSIARNYDEYLGSNQHIYITDNSEIKDGDWYYYKHFGEDIIDKANENTDLANLNKPDRYFKKIIFTTDETLIKQGVQMVGDDFLQWFCNNPNCEYVEIDLTPINEFGSIIKVDSYGFDKFIYKIILPQEQQQQRYSEEEVEVLIYNIIWEVAKKQGIIIDGNIINKAYKKYKKDNKKISKSTSTINIKKELNKWLEFQSLWFENTKKMLNK